MAFPCVSAGAELACNVGGLGSIPELRKSPLEKGKAPTSVFLREEFHGPYSAWSRKESDTTE